MNQVSTSAPKRLTTRGKRTRQQLLDAAELVFGEKGFEQSSIAEITRELLQRSDHRSVQALEKDLRSWVRSWNENPKPFIWTKTAEEILASLGRLLQRTTGAGH